MSIQAKLTAIAVNLKRRAALIDKKSGQDPALGAAILRIGVLLPQFVKLDCDYMRKAAYKHYFFSGLEPSPCPLKQREIDAYNVEIELARKANRLDIVKRLEELKAREVGRFDEDANAD